MSAYQHYTGTKIVRAKPMTRGEFQEMRAGTPGGEGTYEEKGYVVEYEDGYTSWSPAPAFEKAYICIGDATDQPEFIQRLKGERAENYDRLQKLRTFLHIQDEKAAPDPDRTEERQAFLDKMPTLDIHQLALQQRQQVLMAELDDILSQRLELLLPEARVEHRVKLRFSVANSTRFDIMTKVFAALDGQIDLCCYTGTIYNIPPHSVKVFNPAGEELPHARVLTEKLARGFSISGNLSEELLFDIAIDAQRGNTHVTSSFAEDYQIELEVQLADVNRRLL